MGMGAINLTVASLLSSLFVGTAALIGDWALARAERHLGRRPGARLVTPLLAAVGAVSACGIVIDHVRHAPALDGWTGISGSVLLLLAAIAHHHYVRAAYAHTGADGPRCAAVPRLITAVARRRMQSSS